MKFYNVFLKKNLVTLITIAVLFLGIVASGIFFVSNLRKENAIEEKINSELKMFNLFKGKEKYAPTTSWIQYSEKEKEELKNIYDKIMKELDAPSARMPDKVREPLKFKEEIFNVQDELQRQAISKGLTFDKEAQSLGFKEYEKKIPAEEEIPNLTEKLLIAEELVKLMFNSNIDKLTNIKFSDCKDNTLDGESSLSYRVIPIELKITSSVKELAHFLYLLSESEYIFVVNSVNISSSTDEKNKVQAHLNISSIVFLEKKVKKEK